MAMTSFRQLDRSVRRQKIIDTAVELFHRKGYRATSLDDLAQELGISKAALYNYVESKEELLFIIYTQALSSIFEETYRIAGMGLPAVEKLRMIVRNHLLNIIIKNVSLFFVFFTEENQLPEKYYRMVKEKKKEYDRIVQGIIREGIAQGAIEDVDPRLLGYAIVGMCNWLYKWFHPKVPYSPEEIADQFVRLLEKGYLRAEKEGDAAAAVATGERKGGRRQPSLSGTLRALRERCVDMLELIDTLQDPAGHRCCKRS